MSENAIRMAADRNLQADIEKAQTPDEIRELLHRAIERSPELGITRDPVSGQFVRRDPLTPAQQDAAAEAARVAAAKPQILSQTVRIGGQDFTFMGNSAEALELQISSAKTVAQELQEDPEAPARDAEQRVIDQVEADMMLRRGEINTAEYLQRTHAIEDYLASQGVDTQKLAGEQLQQSWAEASHAFMTETEEGNTWRGGNKNLQLASTLLQSHGWDENGINGDRVAALQTVAKEMRSQGLEFDGDVSQAEVEKLTADATPAEILAAWKEAQLAGNTSGDNTAANEAFVNTFINGRSSGWFGK